MGFRNHVVNELRLDGIAAALHELIDELLAALQMLWPFEVRQVGELLLEELLEREGVFLRAEAYDRAVHNCGLVLLHAGVGDGADVQWQVD